MEKLLKNYYSKTSVVFQGKFALTDVAFWITGFACPPLESGSIDFIGRSGFLVKAEIRRL